MSPLPRANDRKQFTTRAGRKISFTTVGFGSAPLGNYLRTLTEEECDATLQTAWDSGIRYFDTAPMYGLGLSEMRVGRLLKRLPRESFTLSSKVGRLLVPCPPEEVNGLFFVNTPQVKFVYDYSYDAIMRSYEESRKRLGFDRIDILFVHDVDAFCHNGREGAEARIQELINQGGWRALTELRASGEIAAIGAGVNEWQPCARLLELVDPDLFLLAGRYTLLEQEPLDMLFPQCAKRGVGGGYVLARHPSEIRVSEIISAVDGPITLGDFGQPHQDGACDHEGQCVLLAIWDVAGQHMREHLAAYTLEGIADAARGTGTWPQADFHHH